MKNFFLGNSIWVRSQQKRVKIPTPWVKKVLRAVLENEKGKGEISVLFVNEKKMAELNFTYRGRKVPTDVLAFPAALPSAPVSVLGDLVVSVPTARSQAKETGIPLSHEIAFLLIHGLLHLLGHDHKKAKERRLMFQKQDFLFRKILLQGDILEKNFF